MWFSQIQDLFFYTSKIGYFICLPDYELTVSLICSTERKKVFTLLFLFSSIQMCYGAQTQIH